MSSLVSRVKSELLDPIAIYRFLDATTKSLTIDSQLGGITGLYNLGESLRGIPSSKIAFFTIPNFPRGEVVPGDTANVLWTQPEDSRDLRLVPRRRAREQHAVRARPRRRRRRRGPGHGRPAPGQPVKHPDRDAVAARRQPSDPGRTAGQSIASAHIAIQARTANQSDLRWRDDDRPPARAATVNRVKGVGGSRPSARRCAPRSRCRCSPCRLHGSAPRRAPRHAAPRRTAKHVVIVGISGLTWNIVTQSATGELWRLAAARLGRLAGRLRAGTARLPGRRLADAELRRPRPGPAPVHVAAHGDPVAPGATVPAMPQIVRDNQQFHESPDWGLLGTLASCATAVGPGRGPRAGLPGRRGRLLRAVGRGPVPVGAGPLSADRHRLGTGRGIRNGAVSPPSTAS